MKVLIFLAPQDYGAPTPAVSLDCAHNTGTVKILILSDSIRESNETLVVILSVLGEINGEINPDRATVTILDGECVDIGIILLRCSPSTSKNPPIGLASMQLSTQFWSQKDQ